MTSIHALARHADELLEIGRFSDYCPNGLQVEGGRPVRRLASGVTASRAFIEAAVARGADALLVHHGYFWKGEDARVTGIKRERLRLLLTHDVSLLAYHLPLDAHPELGNNAQLAARLGFRVEGPLREDGVGLVGSPPETLEGAALCDRLEAALGRRPQWVQGGPVKIRRIGWCTGPRNVIEKMTMLQQYSFVCAPSMVQHGALAALETDVSDAIADYRRKRDMVVDALAEPFGLIKPGGAFYAFVPAPGGNATEFVTRAIERNVLTIPGSVFSTRDSHFRICYTVDDDKLARGLDILRSLA